MGRIAKSKGHEPTQPFVYVFPVDCYESTWSFSRGNPALLTTADEQDDRKGERDMS